MTTVAYCKGVVATDKRITDNGTISTGSCKALRYEDRVFCIMGTLTTGHKFVSWLRDGAQGEAPKLKNTVVFDMDLITGKAVFWEDTISLPIEDSMWAGGSGGDVALGAMSAGKTPAEAVKIATKWDVSTGNGVQVFTSEAAKKRLRRSKNV